MSEIGQFAVKNFNINYKVEKDKEKINEELANTIKKTKEKESILNGIPNEDITNEYNSRFDNHQLFNVSNKLSQKELSKLKELIPKKKQEKETKLEIKPKNEEKEKIETLKATISRPFRKEIDELYNLSKETIEDSQNARKILERIVDKAEKKSLKLEEIREKKFKNQVEFNSYQLLFDKSKRIELKNQKISNKIEFLDLIYSSEELSNINKPHPWIQSD